MKIIGKYFGLYAEVSCWNADRGDWFYFFQSDTQAVASKSLDTLNSMYHPNVLSLYYGMLLFQTHH